MSGGYPVRMLCLLCGADDTKVIDSRPADQGGSIRRRRECLGCHSRFTTYERAEAVLLVRKRDGHIEPFQTEKVRRGLDYALADRPVAHGALESMVEEIEQSARAAGPVIESDVIGRAVLQQLRVLDDVAYLRFASVYKDFKEVGDFEREMASLDAQE